MQKYTGFSLNAWPAFADVMLSVVLVLVMILVLAVATMTGPSYLKVDASQKAIREAIESKSKNGETFEEDSSNTWRMAFRMEDDTRSEIKVVDETLLQRFTFGAGVLFDINADTLNARGVDLITQIEDELLLALPVSPRHAVCPDEVLPEEAEAEKKPSPFAVLANLKTKH